MNAVGPRHQFTFAGNTHNVFHANKGEGLPAHTHNYPHATVCHAGSCEIRKENKKLLATPNTTPIVLGASQWHEIEALEDGTVFENIFMTGVY